jgi:hypothetical protein
MHDIYGIGGKALKKEPPIRLAAQVFNREAHLSVRDYILNALS